MKSTINLFYDYLVNNLKMEIGKQELMLLLISHSYMFHAYLINLDKYSISHKRNIAQNITNILDAFSAFDNRTYWVSKCSAVSSMIKKNITKKMNIAYEKQRSQRSLEIIQKKEGNS